MHNKLVPGSPVLPRAYGGRSDDPKPCTRSMKVVQSPWALGPKCKCPMHDSSSQMPDWKLEEDFWCTALPGDKGSKCPRQHGGWGGTTAPSTSPCSIPPSPLTLSMDVLYWGLKKALKLTFGFGVKTRSDVFGSYKALENRGDPRRSSKGLLSI